MPLTLSTTLDRTVQRYRAHFGRLFAIAVGAHILQLPLSVALEADRGRAMRELRLPPRVWWVMLVTGILVTATSGALTKAALAIEEGAPIGPGRAIAASLKRLPALLVVGAVVLVLSAVAFVPLVIPGIFVFFGFSFSYLVLLGEGLGPWAALRRSWRLAKGTRNRIIGLLVIFGLLQIVLSYAAGGALGLFGLERLTATLGEAIAGALIAPCYPLALCLTYLDVRARREGHDLALEARRLAEGGGDRP